MHFSWIILESFSIPIFAQNLSGPTSDENALKSQNAKLRILSEKINHQSRNQEFTVAKVLQSNNKKTKKKL